MYPLWLQLTLILKVRQKKRIELAEQAEVANRTAEELKGLKGEAKPKLLMT